METLLESRLWKFAMVWGALSAVLGGLILAWPGASILVASTLFGVYLLLSGFAGVAMSFTLPESAGMKVMLFISGVLSVIMAVLCFRNFGTPYPVLLLSIWIGVSFVVQGFSIVAVAISYQALPARGWYAFVGVLSVIAGAIVLVWPWDSIAVLTLSGDQLWFDSDLAGARSRLMEAVALGERTLRAGPWPVWGSDGNVGTIDDLRLNQVLLT